MTSTPHKPPRKFIPPPHVGHLQVILEALRQPPQLCIVGGHYDKPSNVLSYEERLALVSRTVREESRFVLDPTDNT